MQLERVGKRLGERGLSLNVAPRALDFLSEAGYDPLFGARPVKRALQTYVENPLAKEILAGKFAEGETILADLAPDGTALAFTKRA
jgi:ATP-dependent Clp protease ATP-binding subunit ClpB